jgi:hypothetical protein
LFTFLTFIEKVPWNEISSRRKPVIDEGIWAPDVAEDLAIYMDWHARHPHCASPREIDKEGNRLPMKDMSKWHNDDVNKTHKVFGKHAQPTPLPAVFRAKKMSAGGDFDEVSVAAAQLDHMNNIGADVGVNFKITVKDEMERSHYAPDDGTVPFTTNSVAAKAIAQRRRDAANKRRLMNGAAEKRRDAHQRMFHLSTLETPAKYSGRVPMPVFAPAVQHGFNRFTEGGVELVDFLHHERVQLVAMAVREHRVSLGLPATPVQKQTGGGIGDGLASMLKGRGSRKKTKKAKKVPSSPKPPPPGASSPLPMISFGGGRIKQQSSSETPNEASNNNSGKESLKGLSKASRSADGDGHAAANAVTDPAQPPKPAPAAAPAAVGTTATQEAYAEMAQDVMDYASKVREKVIASRKGWFGMSKGSSRHTGELYTKEDELIDAVHSGSLMKLIGLLIVGTDPEALFEDSPILFSALRHALRGDEMSNSLLIGDSEDSERKKTTKMMNALIKYGADADAICPQVFSKMQNPKSSTACTRISFIVDFDLWGWAT